MGHCCGFTNIAVTTCLYLSLKKQEPKGNDVPESFLSSQRHEPFESESSEILSSQSRVTRIVESLRVIDLQARVNVESYKISNFSYIFLAIGPPVDLQWV